MLKTRPTPFNQVAYLKAISNESLSGATLEELADPKCLPGTFNLSRSFVVALRKVIDRQSQGRSYAIEQLIVYALSNLEREDLRPKFDGDIEELRSLAERLVAAGYDRQDLAVTGLGVSMPRALRDAIALFRDPSFQRNEGSGGKARFLIAYTVDSLLSAR